MKVNIQVERRTESLNQRYRSSAGWRVKQAVIFFESFETE